MTVVVKVLIAEDSPTQAEQLRYLLTEHGYDVVVARNGAQALAMAREERPTLVISDIVMPELDGYDLCRALKADEALARTPVILLTSLAEPQNIVSSLACGADNFIRKPYEERYLLSRISNILTGLELRDTGSLRMGVEVFLGGERHFITSERQQILDFLISTYEEIAHFNEELQAHQQELEQREAALAAANLALGGRQAELESALGQLREEKEHVERMHAFSARLLEQTDLRELGREVLRELCATIGAVGGRIFMPDPERGDEVREVATIGLARHEQELRLPLVHGDRQLGEIALAGRELGSLAPDELLALEHLVNQSTVALANVRSLQTARHLATINGAVLDAAKDGIALVDFEGRRVLANAALEAFTRDVPELSPEGGSPVIGDLAGDPDAEGEHEVEFAEAGRSFQVYTAPVRTGEGASLGRIFTVRDTTVEREVERLKTELVATVSHELRSPVTAIMGFSDLLLAAPLDDARRERYLHLIHEQAQRLTALVSDFLDLQRMESGTFPVAREPVDLGEVLREGVELVRAQGTGHSLQLILPDGTPPVLGDRERITQVLANLLSNAVKYSPEGGPVEVEAQAREEMVRVSVRDAGIGIPAAKQDRLFTKFYRVDQPAARDIGGTGLGLAICREMVEAQGGRIGFESREGAGSSFWFELPPAS